MDSKRCTHCNETKPVAEFYRCKGNRDGYNAWCKACHREHARTPEVQEARRAYMHEWNTSEHGRTLKAAHVLSDEAAARRLERQRGDEARERSRLWYRENNERARASEAERRAQPGHAERHQEYLRAYYTRPYALAKRREVSRRVAQERLALLRALPATLTEEEWTGCLEHFDWSCAYCGAQAERLEQDHFIPITADGPYTASNIIVSCRTCNASKGNRMPQDWCEPETYERIAAYLATRQ